MHRLTATLAFLIRLSPFHQDELAPLLGILQVSETLKGKLAGDGKLKVQGCMIRVLLEMRLGNVGYLNEYSSELEGICCVPGGGRTIFASICPKWTLICSRWVYISLCQVELDN